MALGRRGAILRGAAGLFLLAVVPMLVMVVPMTLLLGQLSLWYQARPLYPGEEAVITLELGGDRGASFPVVRLEPTAAVDVIAGPVRVRKEHEVCWNVKAKEPGSHRLTFQVGEQRAAKEIAIGAGFARVSRPETAVGLVVDSAAPVGSAVWPERSGPLDRDYLSRAVWLDQRQRLLGGLLVRGFDDCRAVLPPCARGQRLNARRGEGGSRHVENEIIIVSGLPRSGTSLMMQMLDNGGVPVVTDNIRAADTDNPRGYYEFERVKKIKEDVSWLPEARGKAFKMVSQLLYELPANETYRVIFMERDLDEMICSQDKMLTRLGKPSAPAEMIKKYFTDHLVKLRAWLKDQQNFRLLYVGYREVVAQPDEQAARVSDFLEGRADAASMAKTVDPSLYRNRTN